MSEYGDALEALSAKAKVLNAQQLMLERRLHDNEVELVHLRLQQIACLLPERDSVHCRPKPDFTPGYVLDGVLGCANAAEAQRLLDHLTTGDLEEERLGTRYASGGTSVLRLGYLRLLASGFPAEWADANGESQS